MRYLLSILLLAGLGFLGYRFYETFGRPIQDAVAVDSASGSEDEIEDLAEVEAEVDAIERDLFGPLSAACSSGTIMAKLAELKSISAVQRNPQVLNRIRQLDRAVSTRLRFEDRYQNLAHDDFRSFDPDVKQRRIKLLQQDLEQRWKEARQRYQSP